MARNKIGRNGDDYWKTRSKYYSTPSSTDTEDEDEIHKTSTAASYLEATIIPHLEVTPPVPAPIPITTSSIMSGQDNQPSRTNYGPPWVQGPSPSASRTGDYDEGPPYGPPSGYGPPSTWTTSYSKSKAYSDQNGLGSTPTPTPTQIQSESSPPKPTNDDSGLVNHGADNGSNKTPMYAAAGAAPVVVIVVGFLIFFCLRKRRRQRQAAAVSGHFEEMKMQHKPVERPYVAPITPPSPPPQAALPPYSPSTPSSSHPPTASSSQPVILGPIPSGTNGAYLTGMDTSDLVSMRSGGVSRQGTIVDRDPFADGRSLEEAPPPYRPSSLPPASLASTSRNSSVRIAAPPHMTSRTQLIERSPFDDPEDDEVSDISGPTLGRETDAMSDVSELSYQIDPVVGRSPF
jgi:hypothetical protein